MPIGAVRLLKGVAWVLIGVVGVLIGVVLRAYRSILSSCSSVSISRVV